MDLPVVKSCDSAAFYKESYLSQSISRILTGAGSVYVYCKGLGFHFCMPKNEV